MIDSAFAALFTVFSPAHLMVMVTGVGVGLVVGVIPGLSGTVGMSLLLPFIYGMEPSTAFALLIGMAAVVHTADTFPSVLLGVPGSSGSPVFNDDFVVIAIHHSGGSLVEPATGRRYLRNGGSSMIAVLRDLKQNAAQIHERLSG